MNEDTAKKALDKRLENIGWALFLIMIGGLWLVPKERLPEETWLIGVGIILLGLNAVRYLNGIKMSNFTIGLGILALLVGIASFAGVDLPLFPIILILIGATIFGYYMTLSRIPQEGVTLVGAMDLNRWVVIIGIVVSYFIISMFMDEIPLLLLTLQLTFPLITSLGFDPIWFGVLSMMMVAMGLVFPPVGLLAFVVSATAGVDLMKVYKGCSILMLAIVATTILLMIFPEIALWLPRTMR